ncbi:MAG: YdeI/OmpD-associated family protein [Puia sp.]|nr:YdeI/OmpD-associated family protein [Puia sp.]
MIRFTATILQFAEQGEKTGWSYIKVSAALAGELKPGNKKSFRVKGSLDDYAFTGIALLPMGDGDFIMALNAKVRKAVGKGKGARLRVVLEVDKKLPEIPREFLECLADEPKALDFFNSLPLSHRNYWGNWIRSAKTEPTRAKRIARSVTALARGWDYGQMIRSLKNERSDGIG